MKRNQAVISPQDSALKARKNQAEKGTPAGEGPLALGQSDAVILEERFSRIARLPVVEALNALHSIQVLLEGHPVLEQARAAVRQVFVCYRALHLLCAQDEEAITKRNSRDDSTEEHETCVSALWAELVQPALRWKMDQYSGVLYAFGVHLQAGADLLRHHPKLGAEVRTMRDLASAIDAVEGWAEKIWRIANPPVPKRPARTEAGV